MFRRSIFLLFLGLSAKTSLACGLDWSLPHGHFKNVDDHGYVSYWEKIGELDLGSGLVIPVHINFNSRREAVSPTLGKGWMMTPLESHIEPINENWMEVIMPDGWTFTFFRDSNTNIWRGNAGWIGVANNSIFTISAPCGWKVKFDRGKIQEIITDKGRVLTFKYNGPTAVELDEGSTVIVKQRNKATSDFPSDIQVGNQLIRVTLAQRPKISTSSGQALITAMDSSLSKLQWTDDKVENITFGIGKNIHPNLIIQSENHQQFWAWNPETRHIESDGTWDYIFGPTAEGHPIEQRRINKSMESEYWSFDSSQGSEMDRDIHGIQTVKQWFVAGPLRGLIREITETNGVGQKRVLLSRSYNENGSTIREVQSTPNGSRVKFFDDCGHILRETFGDKSTRVYLYDSAFHLTKIVMRDGKSIDISNIIENKNQ